MLGCPSIFKNCFQEMLTFWDRNITVPNGVTVSSALSVGGYIVVLGQIYSDQNITLNILQGVSDRTGALVYRKTDSIPVAAGVAQNFSQQIFGKFVSVDIVNVSGFAANIEIFAAARAFDL
jgi:hypothetical protein